MAQILKLRRSAIPGAKPTISQIEFGEVAMNTADGKLFMKVSGSGGDSVIEIGANASTGNVSGSLYYIPVFTGANSVGTSSIYQSGSTSVIINQDNNTTANPEALYVSQPHPTSINVISGKGNLNNYLQLNIQNTNNGISASSDIVATANNGSETEFYIDMGINGQNYVYYLGGPNDAYLYAHANNLWIGNVDNGHKVYFFNNEH
jgi:hypothetical protein